MIAVSAVRPHADEPGEQAQGSGSDEVGELVHRASRQLTELVRGELRLAQAEMKSRAGATARAADCSEAPGLRALALTGRKQVAQAAPPMPEQTIENVKADVAEIKRSAQR
ncbi:phage holin family protein [Streptomyces mirabilis]|uniref:phage holin family protein n=1 Tax=Streptomyces mirabilis TaxID=68239 RepID=UPI0036643E0D